MKRDKLFYFEQLFRSNFINRVAQLNLHVYAYCSDLQLVKKKNPSWENSHVWKIGCDFFRDVLVRVKVRDGIAADKNTNDAAGHATCNQRILEFWCHSVGEEK